MITMFHARGGHIVKVVNVFGMFRCERRRLESVDWGGNGTHVVPMGVGGRCSLV